VFEDNIVVNEVHHCLKGCRRIGEAEVHDCWFKQPVFCFESCFVFVAFSNSDVVISPSYVQFGVDVRIAQILYEVRDKGEWILVMHSEGIDLSIVLHWSQLAIFLSYEEEW